MSVVRKQYTDEFKRKAVARLGKESAETICKELKISSNSMLYHWRDKFKGGKKTKTFKGVKVEHEVNVKDAIICLSQARSMMYEELHQGKIKKLSSINRRVLDALDALTGEG